MPDEPAVPRGPERMPDFGPRYAETPADPFAADAPAIAEPWNTATAALFVVVAVYWAVRVWPRWRRHPFVSAALPVLFAGAIGGTLYHATRTQRAYFLLDVIPIYLLGLAGSLYLTARLARSLGPVKVAAVGVGLVAASAFVNGVLLRVAAFDHPNLRVNLSYASLAVVVLAPVLAVLVRTRFRHGAWVGVGLASFAVGWFCRLIDNQGLGTLPMGTHWLWHAFGAVSTHAMIAYFYRVEGERPA